ncbi:DUF551 domain-containing protein [Enterobacter hormaechei subsp. hoffmannii]|uniref:DUF551 domain-containing protein n=1 Tax=Enterobacter hormaechei TaxID=158836 RepID=UPI00079B575F|nr:DUF551 domain-containing protein [Enterobacter hormaechei]MCU2632709.1 DUF551 domain-containing protein [Enterobacter hormaechei subsp. hoffmannii]MCU2747405.1 DUF551 domain-containing protein [Enterobacter hormaechei subsp. hoffmannii]MCU4114306.1 DUF551 domain-containing protein [Enterobacter hormaechei subsp. hoffmannii]MCU4134270.1 DUF551 domain-containing protein [Enterobacter hormaechei subsp. hoffmannii]SAI21892.1 Protein of uncharacterised function (DUF551) [Enterobacter hormaechei]
MSTITKEWLLKTITELEEERDAVPGVVNEDAAMALAAMKRALASLEVEPVAYMYKDNLHADARFSLHTRFGNWSQEDINEYEITEIPLYTAPPAPVSVTDFDTLRLLFEVSERESDHGFNLHKYGTGYADEATQARWEAWVACRAAMLQGAEPVTTAYKLPANTPCKDAPEHIWLQTAGAWPESGEFSELTWCSENQHPDDTLYVRGDAVADNRPELPDGWVACSERMPDIGTEIFYFCQDDGLRGCGIVSSSNFSGKGDAELYVHAEGYDLHFGVDISHWMPLPAAPQQEVK